MNFIDKIAQGFSYDESQVLGYSEEELIKIERLYNIKLQGDFRQFMLEMGRSDGGLIGYNPIFLYNPAWKIREHIVLQTSIFELLQSIRKPEYLRGKTFIFSIEDKGQYYFLRTDANDSAPARVTYKGMETLSDDPSRVYCYDGYSKTVQSIGMSFLEYMQVLVRKSDKGVVSRGDLLMI